MTDQALDDIFALYSQFDLDGENYRVFQRELPTKAAAGRPVQTASILVEEREPITAGPRQGEDRQSPVATERAQIKKESVAPLRPELVLSNEVEQDRSRTALHSLCRHVNSGRHRSGKTTADSLAAASLTVQGVAGGVGTTTVAAILTRLLAKAGRLCAIFDESDDPTLPIFFGAQRIAEDHRRFSGLYSIFEPRIRILNSRMYESPLSSGPHADTFIERNFAAMEGQFDHLIFDQPFRSNEGNGALQKVYVAIPDLRSLAGMQKVMRSSENPDERTKTICVLNRFDSASALHKEVLGWYRENVQDLVVIQESSLVSEALAEGTTVLDWAPNSSVASDFLNLFAASSQLMGSALERLPLCS